MVGGCWSPTCPENAYLDLSSDLDIKGVKKSKNLLQFLVWDPSAYRKLPLPVAEMPIEHNFKASQCGQRSCLYMLDLVGRVLSHSRGTVKAVIFDAATSHAWIRKALHGQIDDINKDEGYASVPFFPDLKYKDLPDSVLPRLPIKLAYIGDESIWAIPGVCALFKV